MTPNQLGSIALALGALGVLLLAWLALRRGLTDARDALAAVRAARPRAVWSDEGVAVLQHWIDRRAAGEA